MMLQVLTSFFLLITASLPAFAATYYMSDNIQGNGFYNAFEWQAISDPTHGRVYACLIILDVLHLNLT
jgi:hypothetical protein